MLKKILSVAVVLAMCLTMGTVMPMIDAAGPTAPTEPSEYFKGEGTEDEPYQIWSAEDLTNLAYVVDTEHGNIHPNPCTGLYFEMMQDIDLSTVCGKDIGGEEVSWMPVGVHGSFSGTFDGGGHKITNLYINNLNRKNLGVFGKIYRGTVKNLTVYGEVHSNVSGQIGSEYYGGVGGVVGFNQAGTVENCHNYATVDDPESSNAETIGGVVGFHRYGTIRNCSNHGTVSGKHNVGGIVGYNYDHVKIQYCYNYGEVSGSADSVGGISGEVLGGTIEYCGNYGNVSGRYMVGGVTGGISNQSNCNGTVVNCYNIGDVSGSYYKGFAGTDYCRTGGVVGIVHMFDSADIITQNNYNFGQVKVTKNGRVEVTSASVVGGVLIGKDGTGNIIIENCYFLEDGDKDGSIEKIGDIKQGYKEFEGDITFVDKSKESFNYGELAYILQGLQEESEVIVWGQRLTTEGEHDATPITTTNPQYKVLKVTFMHEGGEVGIQYANPNTTFAPRLDSPPEPPEGKVLAWCRDPDGNSEIYFDEVTVVGDDDPTVFYAVFRPASEKPINVTLHYRYPEGEDKTEEITVKVGETYGSKLPAAPTFEGYTFDGWFTEANEPVNGDTPVEESILDLYAHWTKLPEPEPEEITVTLHYRYPEGEDKTEEITVKVGEIYGSKLPEAPTFEGYTFSGWYTEEDDDGKRVYSTDNADESISDLYARWTKNAEQVPAFTHPQPINGLIYDCTEQRLITPGIVVNGTMLYRLSETDVYLEDIPVGTNAGEYTVWYKVEGSDGYKDVGPWSLTVRIAKADPVPPKTDLNAIVGQTLKDVEPQLPDGYTWADNTQSVGNVGENLFAATFTPKNTGNLNILEDIPIPVKVAYFIPPQAKEKLVYDRTEQELIIPGITATGTMVYMVEEVTEEEDGKKEEEDKEAGEEQAERQLLISDSSEDRQIFELRTDDGYNKGETPTGIDAGTYKIYYKVIDDDIFNGIN